MSEPTVLFLIDTLEVGGTERSILEIASRFGRYRPQVCQIYPGDRLRPRFERAGIPVHALEQEGRFAFVAAAAGVRKVAEEVRPAIIHVALFRAGIVGRWVGPRLGIPVVDSLVNDSYSPRRWQRLGTAGRLKLGMVRALDAATAPRVARFMAVSDAVRRSNARALRIPLDRIEVIHRGRDPARFSTLDADQRRSRRGDLGLDPGDRLVLNVSRLLGRKGQAELIEAHRQVSRAFPDAHLWIVGDGPERSALEERIARSGLGHRVRLLGTREDVHELLQLADVFVLPSHYEGHSGALIEAMMAGLPIVATDTPSNRESVDDGETARLVPVGDPDALGSAVSWVLAHAREAEEQGRRARDVARERFDVARVAARHEAFYDRVLGLGGEGGVDA